MIVRLVLLLACLGLANPVQAEKAAQWWATPAMQMPRVSPDGAFIASVRTDTGGTRVEVQRIDGSATYQPFKSRSMQVHQLVWLSPERLLIKVSKPGHPASFLAVERSGYAPRRLTRSTVDDRKGPALVDSLPGDPLHVLISDDRRIAWQPDVYRINVYTGESTRVEANPGRTWVWMTDGRGRIRLRGDYYPVDDGIAYRWFWRNGAESNWRPFYSSALGAPGIEPLGFDLDQRNLLVLSDLKAETRGLYRFDPVASRLGEALFQHPEFPVDDLRFSGRTGQPASVLVQAGLPDTTVLEPQWMRWMAGLKQDLPEGRLRVVSSSADESVIVVKQFSDRDSGRYWLHQPGSGQTRLLGEVMPGVSLDTVRPTHPLTLPSRDGLELQGYLSLPESDGPHPLVVYVHGGPWQRDRWGFDPMTQMLTHQGIAVLKVNFRGSAGFGRDFLMAGQREWGRAMQDDLVDAVRWARRVGHAGEQVCIMGMSYGGYAALMGVLRDPETFDCAVAYAPVTDLPGFIERFRQRGDHKGYAEWRAMVGVPGRADHELDRVSPVGLADQLSRPVLLAHGIHDQTVPAAQSIRFRQSAPKQQVQWLPMTHSGHELAIADERQRYFREVSRFLLAQLQEPAQ